MPFPTGKISRSCLLHKMGCRTLIFYYPMFISRKQSYKSYGFWSLEPLGQRLALLPDVTSFPLAAWDVCQTHPRTKRQTYNTGFGQTKIWLITNNRQKKNDIKDNAAKGSNLTNFVIYSTHIHIGLSIQWYGIHKPSVLIIVSEAHSLCIIK